MCLQAFDAKASNLQPKECSMFSFSRKTAIAVATAMLLSLGVSSHAEAKEIRIGYLVADQLHHPAVMVMKQRKMLEEAGLTVKWNEFLGGSYVMQEMASGSLDFASCGAAPVAITNAQGVKLNIIGSCNQEGSALVVGNNVKSIKDLEGKNIGTPGTGSIQDAMLAQLLKDNGVRARRMSMKVSDMPLFLQKGEIAGFIAWQPHAARAVAHNFGKIMYTSSDMMPNHQCCVLVTPAAKVKEDPELVRTFMKVYLDAYKWFLEHPEETVQMTMKVTGMSEDIIREAVKSCKYAPVPYCDVESIKAVTEGLISTRKIVSIKKDQVPQFMEELYNPSFVEELTGTKRP